MLKCDVTNGSFSRTLQLHYKVRLKARTKDLTFKTKDLQTLRLEKCALEIIFDI